MSTDLTKLPDLEKDYPLTGEQITSFQNNGHILLRGIVTAAEIEAYRVEILKVVKEQSKGQKPLSERDAYGQAFLQITNIWEFDEAVRKFVFGRRFAQIAAQLMGVSGARLYHDQALFKEPGGGVTPWHQDQYYWPLQTDNTITMWMPTVDASAEMGTLQFASGSHKAGYFGELEISTESQQIFSKLVKDKGYAISKNGPMKAGDASFHYGWTLHCAEGNSTDRLREVMTIIYFPDGTIVGPADNKARNNDLQRWLPGLKPGDVAASPLNPLLYKK